MTVLITMAGLGSRFAAQGYTCPKYQIMANGRSLFDWSMLSMQAFFGERFVFACLQSQDVAWLRDAAQAVGIRDAVCVPRAELSRGQAETAFDALPDVDPLSPLWIYNIDTYVTQGMSPGDLCSADGCLHVFESTDPGMSFVRYDTDGGVAEIAEKRVISRWATVGLYGFSSARAFADLYLDAYERQQVQVVGGERYVAPIYDLMLARGQRVIAPKLSSDAVHILGTPAQVLAFDPLAVPPKGRCVLS